MRVLHIIGYNIIITLIVACWLKKTLEVEKEKAMYLYVYMTLCVCVSVLSNQICIEVNNIKF